MTPLTRRQREILDYLVEFIQGCGYAPSLEEIGRRFGLTSLATVHKHMSNLEAKGYIRRQWNHARSIEIMPGGPTIAHQMAAAFTAGFQAACNGDLIEEALEKFVSSTTNRLQIARSRGTVEGSYDGRQPVAAPTSRE